MDVIRLFLDNIFAAYQRTEAILKVKKELYSSMEDRYNELRSEGKSEHETIGILISGFGNIEELLEEMNLGPAGIKAAHIIPISECEEYIMDKKKSSFMVAFGVVLCIMAPAFYVLAEVFLASQAIAVSMFFLMIAIAAALFIVSGKFTQKYNYMKEGFILDYHITDDIAFRLKTYRHNYPIYTAVGVVLCILSPLSHLLISSSLTEGISTFVFFLIIAAAVSIFIYTSSVLDAYKLLLHEDENSLQEDVPPVTIFKNRMSR